MPRTPIDYSKTIIYKIVCNDLSVTDFYIGHTTEFRRRRYDHKSNCNNEKSKQFNLPIYKFIREHGGWFSWVMIQIEQYECKNVNEARARERYHIELLKPALNSRTPNRTIKEWFNDNKEQLAEYIKKYYEQNKEIITIKN